MNHPASRSLTIALWTARICFAVVFIINVQCALQFIFEPARFAPGFQLSGMEGNVAVMGLGVAFLMWNCTYPLFIVRPETHLSLGLIIVVQQVVGLIGESAILLMLPSTATAIADSISRFVAFDGAGLILMGVSLAALYIGKRRADRSETSDTPRR